MLARVLAVLLAAAPGASAALLAPEVRAAAAAPAPAAPAALAAPLSRDLAALPLAPLPVAVSAVPIPVAAAPAPVVPAPAAAAPAALAVLRVLSVPSAPSAAPSPALPEGAAFDGARPARALDAAVPAAPLEGRSAVRLQVLSAAELGHGAEPDAPPPPAPERRPFLYRHYRAVRFVAGPLLRLFYRVRVDGLSNLPAGPILIVPNHVSFLDPVLVAYAANRPVRFLMYRPIYETRGLEWLFRSLGAIPISTKDPKPVIEESLNRARRALAAGESVAIFPEGQVTRDGAFNPFRRGFERVAAGLPVAVVPAYVDGMWGSALSRHPAKGWLRSLRARLRGRRRAGVRFGPPLERAEAGLARAAVARLAEPR